jgi:hypothetical protein
MYQVAADAWPVKFRSLAVNCIGVMKLIAIDPFAGKFNNKIVAPVVPFLNVHVPPAVEHAIKSVITTVSVAAGSQIVVSSASASALYFHTLVGGEICTCKFPSLVVRMTLTLWFAHAPVATIFHFL